MKRMLCLLLMALVIFCNVPYAAATEVTEDCSIEVLVKYNGININDGKLTAIRVGYVDEIDRVFKQVTDHKTVTDIGTQKAVNSMVEYYNKNKATLVSKTVNISEGKALFDKLSTGLYLILQTDTAEGYNPLAPFLVTLPYIVEGKETYNVSVSAKAELKRVPSKPTSPPKDLDEKLPQTGQLNWPVPALASAGMTLFILGWWLCFGCRKDSNEA